ncbi:protein ZNRD2-like [Clytia hemisphaerica]|uniref:protein ZNRD2-like n=1 Tax=Clytia hemisphaerica TaxID=252671 RepID=UPI0034D75BF4
MDYMADGLNPMSEEDQLRLKKQRERNNKISKLMGDYLLKGYKMLGSTCNKCQAILLRDRQGEDYCVGCVEVDAPPQYQPNSSSSQSRPNTTSQITGGRMELDSRSTPTSRNEPTNSTTFSSSESDKQTVERSIECIYAQIAWANHNLSIQEANLEQRNQLISFLRNCFETIECLKKHR